MTDSYKHYTETTYAGRKLLEEHKLTETGIWQIKGEDPNCDMGGNHHEPDLGYYSGTLEETIRYAVNLKGFWQWGGGGRITRPINNTPEMEDVERFVKVGAALAKLTDEEKILLGLVNIR